MSASPIAVDFSLDNFFTRHPDIQKQNVFAVAVSGGPDSMALLHSLWIWAQNNKKQLHVLTVDHALRKSSAEEAQGVANWVETQNSLHIHHQILRWEGKKPDSAIMEAARRVRYALMADYCKAHDVASLFVAHHQDDQVETFLIRLAKGSGLDGLAGMEEVSMYQSSLFIIRPFLELPKEALVQYCKDNAVDVVQDPSNENTDYLRPRLRKSKAVLEEEGLTAKRLSTLTQRLRRARSALEIIAEKSYKNCVGEKNARMVILDFKFLKEESEETAFRVLQKSVSDLRERQDYGVRMDRLESLFQSLWFNSAEFKPRTLGGLVFTLKDKNSALCIEVEHDKTE